MSKVNPGDPIKATSWNQLDEAANRKVSVGRNMVMKTTPTGIHLDAKRGLTAHYGIVRECGSCGDGEECVKPTDNTYYVDFAYVSNDSGDCAEAIELTAYPTDDPRFKQVLATNLSEAVNQTHNIQPDTPVVVYSEYDRSSPALLKYWMTVDPPIVKRGTVVGDPHEDCSNFVTVQPEGTTEEGDRVLVWLQSPHGNSCPKKNFDEEGIILYIDSIAPGEGEAIQPDIGGMMFRTNGEEQIRTVTEYNLINTFNDRTDNDIAKFASEDCDDLTQINVESKANTVIYNTGSEQSDGIRIFDVSNDPDNPMTGDADFSTWINTDLSMPYESVTDLDADTRHVQAALAVTVPMFADDIWINFNINDGDRNKIYHIGPDMDSAVSLHILDAEWDGCDLVITPEELLIDGKGHIIDVGSGEAITATFPTTTKEVVTDVVCEGGNVIVTKETITIPACGG